MDAPATIKRFANIVALTMLCFKLRPDESRFME
jgi:hypothetical protein